MILLLLVGCSSPTPPRQDASTPEAPSSSLAPASSVAKTTGPEPIPQTAAGDPASLGRQLALAEETIRDPAAPFDRVAAAGRLQQRDYRRLGDHPEWLPEVLSQLPDHLQPAVATNLRANLALRSLGSGEPPLDEMPAWRIVQPSPPPVLLAWYREAEAATGVPWTYLAAINLVETRMGRIVGLSTAGARGPMQFLPSTWEECCTGDIDDPHDSIRGAAVYLRSNGAPSNMAAALRRYNNSARYVEAITAYAEVLAADEQAYRGYHAWEVYVSTSAGSILLQPGYEERAPVPVGEWLARHPSARPSS